MGCKNCGNGNRHIEKDIPLIGDLKEKKKAVITNEGPRYMSVSESEGGDPVARKPKLRTDEMPSPKEAFQAAKELSYEEIINMTDAQQQMMDKSSMEAMRDMTVAMKRYHVISLLGVANYDTTTMTGISPSQALIGLHKVLLLDEFKCINEMYPTLLEQVQEKVDRLMQTRIIID